MDKFVIRTKKSTIANIESSNRSHELPNIDRDDNVGQGESSPKRARVCESHIVNDPGLRKPINDHDPRIRDDVRREYVTKGPCQPLSHNFVKSKFGKYSRCFQVEWFKKWEWLEYSVSKDAAFCFWCYLFKGGEGRRFGEGVFVTTGFRNWKKACDKFKEHVGAHGSVHNDARALFFAFKNQRQSLTRKMTRGKEVLGEAYRTRLTASLDATRYLLRQEMAFRGHDETRNSLNRGNFLELLDLIKEQNPNVRKVAMENAPENHQLTCHDIQMQLISACASRTTKAIIDDIGDKFFSLLIDEARDNSVKEQMAIVLRYLDKHGVVMERFLGVVHVVDTTALSLKWGVDEFFAKYGLSISKLRGQGYDGASNMRGELGGLKTLILNENPSARYIHCFAHQLQLVVVAVVRANQIVSTFFEYLSIITNMVGASCKRRDEFRQKQHESMVEKLLNCEISTGKGLNQESSLARPGSTRWDSHYTTIVRLLHLWSPTIQVLENVFDDGADLNTRGIAGSMVEKMEDYEFVFVAHLMVLILGMTEMLSQFLQKKDQNILEAVELLEGTKKRMQDVRDNGWDALLQEINHFCVKNNVTILNMEDNVPGRNRSRRFGHPITYERHFRIEIFYEVIDKIILEMGDRFNESNTELLTCIACLDPKNSFSNFDESKLLRLAELYPHDFPDHDKLELKNQLGVWIFVVREKGSFSKLLNIGDLAKTMVEVGIHNVFHLVYRLIEFILVLPVATATVERVFSAMNIIKTNLHNKMSDDFLSDSLVCYVEKDVFKSIDNESIMQHFQSMRTRKIDLPPLHFEEPEIES